MEAADLGASDGSIVIDQLWKRRLQKVLDEEPIAASLKEAARTLPGVDQDDLEAIIDGQSEAWGDELHLPEGRFRLPTSYPVDYAIAIHIYTLEDPRVYAVVNHAMFNPSRRKPGAPSHISDELRACLPFIKFLDAALAALPAEYVFRGEVRRGVKWVFPKPESHDPEAYFAPGAKLCWYEFKSTSKQQELMTREQFCGIDAGPRTIFTVQACRAYDIARFSFYQGEQSEYEVLFRPLSLFKVVHSQKNIIDPRKKAELEASGYHGMGAIQRSGFPDAISLEQLGGEQSAAAVVPPPAAPADEIEEVEAYTDDDDEFDKKVAKAALILRRRAASVCHAGLQPQASRQEARQGSLLLLLLTRASLASSPVTGARAGGGTQAAGEGHRTAASPLAARRADPSGGCRPAR